MKEEERPKVPENCLYRIRSGIKCSTLDLLPLFRPVEDDSRWRDRGGVR